MNPMVAVLKRMALVSLVPGYIVGLRRATRRAQTIDEYIRVATEYRWRSLCIAPKQVFEEIRGLLELLASSKPKRLLEVGTAQGGTLYLLSRVAAPDAELVSVDLPGGKFGGSYPLWKGLVFKSFALHPQRMTLIRADSHDPDTKRRVEQLLKGAAFDFILIDGDHSYAGAKRDFELYGPLLAKGGMIAFHDIVDGPESKVGGVPRLWKELREKYRHQEFVKSWNQGGYGLGVIWPDGSSA